MALDVVVRMTAQEAGAYRAWVEQQRAIGDTTTKMGALGGKTREARGEVTGYFSAQAGKWVAMATGIGGVIAGLQKVLDLNRELRSEQSQATFSVDELMRRFAVQAQMTEAQIPEARQRLFEVARENAAPIELVVESAKQLVSSGFSADEVLKGGGARELVQAIKASTAEGKDFSPQQAAESITRFILAQSRESDRQLSRGNLQSVLRGTQALYLQRNIQFADLSDLAKAAPALSGAGIDTTTQLALFTKLRDVLESADAATALRNVVVRMSTVQSSKTVEKARELGASDEEIAILQAGARDKAAALAQMGLKPEDVDLVGESIDEALKRMKEGLHKLPRQEQTRVLKTLFEERGMQGARVLIENYEDVAKYRGEATDASRFDRALRTATSGEAAARTRLELQKQEKRAAAGGAADDELIAAAIEASGEAGLAEKARAKAYLAAREKGVSREVAATSVGADLLLGKLYDLKAPGGKQGEAPSAAELAKKKPADERAIEERAAERDQENVQRQEFERRKAASLGSKLRAAVEAIDKTVEELSAQPAAPVKPLPEENLRREFAPKTGDSSSRKGLREQIEDEGGAGAGGRNESELRELLSVLKQIEANTSDKEVKIKNPGDPQRRARRAAPGGPPTASLGR